MDQRQESLELIRSTHQFPTAVMFKVIGVNEPAFVSRVVATVRDALHSAEDPPFRTRITPQGRHISVTIEPYLTAAEQVLLVSARLRAVPGVVMLM
jgi:putative lipoic acid-binding regulatory protein